MLRNGGKASINKFFLFICRVNFVQLLVKGVSQIYLVYNYNYPVTCSLLSNLLDTAIYLCDYETTVFAIIQIGINMHLDLLTLLNITWLKTFLLLISPQDPAGPSDSTDLHGLKRKAEDSDSEPEPEDNVR